MIQFLEGLLNWMAAEIMLSGLLFICYHFWIRGFSSPFDRFNFLSLSFGSLLFLPWVPAPVISEPFIKNLIIGATFALQGNTSLEHINWVRNTLVATVPVLIPLAYFSLLSIRCIRLFNAFKRVTQIADSGTPIETHSIFPVILHQLSFPPMTIGLWKPKILISKKVYDALSGSEIDMIIQHEEEHIRRLDGLANLVRIVVREILFFSPFIWNLSKNFEEEMEISVDMAVLAQNGMSAKAYGGLLVTVSESSLPEGNSIPIAAYLSNSSIARRLRSMKQLPKDRSKVLSGLAMGLFMGFGTVGVSVFGTQAYSASNKVEFYLMGNSTGTIESPRGKALLVDSDFSSAVIQSDCPDKNGKCSISLHLLPESQKRFSALSARNIGKKIGIVVNEKLVSSPVLKSAITSSDLQITAAFSKDEAMELVKKIGSRTER